MAKRSDPASADQRAHTEVRDRRATALFALAATTLALVVAQFALAGLGAFTMDKTRTDNAYGAHVILGIVIGAMAWLIFLAVLFKQSARTSPRTLRPAVALALLAVPIEPLLGEAGRQLPLLGALHALNGLLICALSGWLTAETGRRSAAAKRLRVAFDAGTRVDAP